MNTLLQEITEQVRAMGLKAGTRLPPRTWWARRLGCSLPCVDRLFAELHEGGTVTVVPRRGVFVGTVPAPDPSLKLLEILKGQIDSGELRPLDPLPSYKSLQTTYGVSPTTVSAAFSQLRRMHLVHARGKRLLAGRPPSAPPRRKHILLLTPSSAYLSRILDQTSPYSAILQAFFADLARSGVELCSLPFQGNEFDRSLRRGRPVIRDNVGRLGGGLASCLFISHRLGTWRGEDIYDSLLFLKEFGVPVVWLDLDRLHSDDPRRLPESYTVVHDSQVSAVVTLGDYLEQAGHRSIAFVEPFYLRESCRSMAALFEREWTARGSEFRFVAVESKRPWFFENIDLDNYGHHKGIPFFVPRPDAVAFMKGRGMPWMRTFLAGRSDWRYIYKREALLIENTPLLAAALRDTSVSCIVAPDGYTGCVARQWMRMQGVAVPDMVSVVAFDGHGFALTEGITTVDRFEAVGRALARLCLGGIGPQQRPGTQPYSATPILNLRSSSGPPPRRRERFEAAGALCTPGSDPVRLSAEALLE